MWNDLWIDDDFYQITEGLVNRIYRINDDGMLEPMMTSQYLITPWISLGTNNDRHCSIWMDLYYKQYHFYPEYCLNRCFKVVAYPKNCKETFELYELMRNYGGHCKIGIDLRDYTPNKSSNFSAFFYCDNQEHGQEVYEKVKKLVAQVNPDMTVLLKKSCTEMELDKELKLNPEWEKRLDSMYVFPKLNKKVPPFVNNRTRVYWLKHARSVGDMTYKDISLLPADEGKYELYQKEK